MYGKDIRFCPEHLAEARHAQDAKRGTAAERGYDATWRAKRDKFLKDHPFCARCSAIATIAHHIIRRRFGGSDDDSNLEALCMTCHSRLHAKSGESFGR